MTALHAPPVPVGRSAGLPGLRHEEGAGMTRVLPFPSARRLRRRRRARIEALVAHLIDLLDADDAADADREPEPDEDDGGGEADAAPLSLNNGSLAPQRRLRQREA